MGPEKNKSIGIFWIGQQINTVDNTGEKKNTIIEKSEINRETEDICYTKGDSNQCGIEENSRAEVEWLFKSITFRDFLFEKFGTADDIKGWDNFTDENNPYNNNHRHLNISMKKEKNNRKNTVNETREKEHEKIILPRSELQEILLIIW